MAKVGNIHERISKRRILNETIGSRHYFYYLCCCHAFPSNQRIHPRPHKEILALSMADKKRPQGRLAWPEMDLDF